MVGPIPTKDLEPRVTERSGNGAVAVPAALAHQIYYWPVFMHCSEGAACMRSPGTSHTHQGSLPGVQLAPGAADLAQPVQHTAQPAPASRQGAQAAQQQAAAAAAAPWGLQVVLCTALVTAGSLWWASCCWWLLTLMHGPGQRNLQSKRCSRQQRQQDG